MKKGELKLHTQAKDMNKARENERKEGLKGLKKSGNFVCLIQDPKGIKCSMNVQANLIPAYLQAFKNLEISLKNAFIQAGGKL